MQLYIYLLCHLRYIIDKEELPTSSAAFIDLDIINCNISSITRTTYTFEYKLKKETYNIILEDITFIL